MKFAYLIMAHNNPEQLQILLHLLDYEENDIYLHLDKKSKELNVKDYENCLRKASIHVYQKYKVYHADFSQTKCQTFLLRESCKTFHDYYHLISNADLPLKTNNEIKEFFERHKGKQFVHFESYKPCLKENCIYYHFFYSLICKSKGRIRTGIIKLDNLFINLQKKLGIRRSFYCGANWYSITQELADDFLRHYRKILSSVKYTISSDELVLQTFLKTVTDKSYEFYKETDSPNDYTPIVRAIDWHRGNPYVWREADYEYLINSEYIFARKFVWQVDKKLIKDISNYVKRK